MEKKVDQPASSITIKPIFNNLFSSFSPYFESLDHLARLVEAKSKEFNITAIKEYEGIWVKHIMDSLFLLKADVMQDCLKKDNLNIIDIGTGAGFPGLPLAIVCPSVDFTLVDGTNKKIQAVNDFVIQLKLSNVRALWGRTESLQNQTSHKNIYDLVLARGVKYLPQLLEILVPFTTKNGLLAVYKSHSNQEQKEGMQMAKKLNLKLVETYKYHLPNILEFSPSRDEIFEKSNQQNLSIDDKDLDRKKDQKDEQVREILIFQRQSF